MSTISGNVATGSTAGGNGGGIFNQDSLTVEDSTLSGNSANNQGGGILSEGTLFVYQSTLSGNTALSNGGGISISGGSSGDIENSTITNNLATSGSGGGLFNDALSDVYLESTIVAGNFKTDTTTPDDVDGPLNTDSQFNLIGVGDTLTGITTGNQGNQIGTAATPLDALLGALADNGGPTLTHLILPGSPAINKGSNPGFNEFDQRGNGFPRTIGAQTDIGAVEAQIRLSIAGGGPRQTDVKVFDAQTGTLLATVTPYPGFMGGVRTAVADVNGDGTLDLITGAGPGGGANVIVFDGSDNFTSQLYNFIVFPGFMGGIYIAAADFDGDHMADFVIGADAGGGPNVIVISGADGTTVMQDFFPYPTGFTGGVRVATGDITGDGTPDIITGAGPGGGPNVRVFDGSMMQVTTTPVDIGGPLGNFFPYSVNFTGGVYVASGDIDGDGRADIITGAGADGGPNVKVYSGADGSVLVDFFAYAIGFTGGVTVGSTQGPDNDGIDDIITGAGPGGGPNLRIFSAANGIATKIADMNVFAPSFTGGIFVSGGTTPAMTEPPLLFGGGPTAGDAAPLTQSQLDSIADAALVRLASEGASQATIDALSTVHFVVTDLPRGVLGLSLPGTVLIDVNASGAGFFIDSTPLDDSEFDANLNAVSTAAIGRVDLLTVVLHELGHQLGADDIGVLEHPESLMADSLTTGKRRLPNADLDVFFANSDSLDSVLS